MVGLVAVTRLPVQSAHIRNAYLPSISIEGSDCSGKTTLVKTLENFCVQEGIPVICNKGSLLHSYEYQRACGMLGQWNKEDLRVLNTSLLQGYLKDADYQHDGAQALVQDSYVARTLAFCNAYDIPILPEWEGRLHEFYHFDINVFLCVDDHNRRRRRNYVVADKMLTDLCENPAFAKKMDTYYCSLVQQLPNPLIIDTNINSSVQVAHILMEHYQKVRAKIVERVVIC